MVEGEFIYDGSTKIHAEVQEDTCQIVLHADFDVMEIDTVFLKIEDHDAEIVFDFNLEKNYIRITPVVAMLAQSKLEIEINFKVVVPTGTDGLYLAFYDDHETGTLKISKNKNEFLLPNENFHLLHITKKCSGDRKYLLTTQFETVGARMTFPCFDEPRLKERLTMNFF